MSTVSICAAPRHFHAHTALRAATAGLVLLSAASSAATPVVPLCEGLQIVTAIDHPNGDYESIKTVESMDATVVRLRYSSEQLVTDPMADDFGRVRKTLVRRTVRRADLRDATSYQQRYFAGMAELIPGTTAIGTSATVLAALRGPGQAELSISNAYDASPSTDRAVSPNIYDFQTTGALQRFGPRPALMTVLVNGVSTSLPTIVARGDFAGELSEFQFLDDSANPLTLAFRIGIGAVPPVSKEQREQCETMAQAAPELARVAQALCGRSGSGDSEVLQVVKITHRCPDVAKNVVADGSPGPTGAQDATGLPPGAAELERALASAGRVDVYDIHFSFDSDRIREESLPRLAEIAAVLRRHPDWHLVVAGHTDAIGGDAYNMALSQRRAAAVKAALVTRHEIAATRLTTAGHGETQPRAANETLQGRARNRRVELVRS